MKRKMKLKEDDIFEGKSADYLLGYKAGMEYAFRHANAHIDVLKEELLRGTFPTLCVGDGSNPPRGEVIE